MSLSAIATLLGPITEIIGRVVPDPNKQAEIRSELLKATMNADSEFYKAAGSIITSEAQGESWMQRNWRPITMLTFVFIVGNNYVLVPYVTWFSEMLFAKGWIDTVVAVPLLEVPDGLWTLLQIGIGGYITSRGVEKVTRSVQEGGIPLVGSRRENSITRDDLDRSGQQLLDELRSVQ